MLRIDDLSFNYGAVCILAEIEASVMRGQILSVVGPNGTGKTTLIKSIARIVRPSGGTIRIDGTDTSRMTHKELARRVAYVPQHAPDTFPMTVFDTVLMGRRPHVSWRPSDQDLYLIVEIIREMNLEAVAMRTMDQLSGGQVQKVLLARAMVQEPDYLLLDEPTSSLDLYHQLEVLEIIAALIKNKKMGAVIAMHDLDLAARFSDTVIMIKDGKVFGTGTPAELISPENIRAVYGVEAAVDRANGYLHVQPLRCTGERAFSNEQRLQ